MIDLENSNLQKNNKGGELEMSNLFGKAMSLLSEWKKHPDTRHLPINRLTNDFFEVVSGINSKYSFKRDDSGKLTVDRDE